MAEVPGSVLVVGGGFAAGHAVTTLRAEGFAGGITVVGAEPHLPYERPPLSKDYLQGKAERDSVFVHPASWYSEHAWTCGSGTARPRSIPAPAR